MQSIVRIVAISSLLTGATLTAVLFVPPIRDKVFTTKLWPWHLPWDTTAEELEHVKAICQPGDVIIESNLHGWQWIALCLVTTGTSWVHAALVDEQKRLLTVEREAIQTDFDIYLRWSSTRLALVRPPYISREQAQQAIDYAHSKLGRSYDPSFTDHAGNCNGLVATSLAHVGLPIEQKTCLGRRVYAGDCFFKIPGAEIIWTSGRH